MRRSIRASALGDARRHRPAGWFGLACVVVLAAAALLGPSLAPHDPFAIAGAALVRPSAAFPMGTDALGRDLLSAILVGARTSVVVAVAVTTLASLAGSAIGMVAGYAGGLADDLLMRATEVAQVIPRFFLAVVTIALFGPGLDRLILVLSLTSWPSLARLVRGEVIAMRGLDFVRAADALGATHGRILRVQVLPNLRPTIVVASCLLFAQVLLLDAALGFLGLGDPSRVSWGQLAAQAQGFLRTAWWLALFPGAAITLSVVGLNLLADAWSARDQRP